MADGTVAVTEGAGKLIDNEELTVNAKIVERQRVRIGGGGAAELTDVRNAAPGANDYGVVTRPIPSGTQPVSATSLPLPTGASTEATLALIKAKTDNLDVALSTRTKPADTQAISVATLPLPAGAAQDGTDITTPVPAMPAGGVGIRGWLSAIWTKLNASIAVTGSFWQATQPVSAASLPLPTGAATEATLAAVSGKLPATLGQKTAAASMAVVLASDASGATQASANFSQPRQLATYTAIFRLAARPYALSNAFGAAGRKQFATIHHLATATKTVKLKRVEVALESSSAAAIVMADLVRITTAPATGNPAVTQAPTNPADAVSAETVCLALPTTAGTEGAVQSMLEWNLGITAAGSVLNPPPGLSWYTLWPQVQGGPESVEDKWPTIRAGVLEGYAVVVDCNALSTIKGYVVIEFTEE